MYLESLWNTRKINKGIWSGNLCEVFISQTSVIGGEYLGTALDIKVFVYDLNKYVTLDVYDEILQYSGKKRISPQLMAKIESREGWKVVLESMDHKIFSLDVGQLID